MYTKGKFYSGNVAIDEVKSVRLSCNAPEHFENDELSVHVVAYNIDDEVTPVATERLSFDGDVYSLGEIFVVPGFENDGYEDFVLKMLIYHAFRSGASKVFAYVLEKQAAFFESEGFTRTGTLVDNLVELFITPAGIHRCCEKNI